MNMDMTDITENFTGYNARAAVHCNRSYFTGRIHCRILSQAPFGQSNSTISIQPVIGTGILTKKMLSDNKVFRIVLTQSLPYVSDNKT